jgi:hypothetical protein
MFEKLTTKLFDILYVEPIDVYVLYTLIVLTTLLILYYLYDCITDNSDFELRLKKII